VLFIFLVRWLLLAVAIGVAARVVPDVEVAGGAVGLVVVSAIFGLVNAFLGPLLRLLTLPLTLMTFGLFALVVNGLLLAITAGLSDYLDVGGFLQTVLAAFLISVLSWVIHRL
jgi:putative membrane protein